MCSWKHITHTCCYEIMYKEIFTNFLLSHSHIYPSSFYTGIYNTSLVHTNCACCQGSSIIWQAQSLLWSCSFVTDIFSQATVSQPVCHDNLNSNACLHIEQSFTKCGNSSEILFSPVSLFYLHVPHFITLLLPQHFFSNSLIFIIWLYFFRRILFNLNTLFAC